jgi:hypothetical protein
MIRSVATHQGQDADSGTWLLTPQTLQSVSLWAAPARLPSVIAFPWLLPFAQISGGSQFYYLL